MANIKTRKIEVTSSSGRSCVGCTKCCEGWLSATIDGQTMYPGRPCQYAQIGRGCANYSNRPVDPCVNFKCEWLVNESVPEWMKPSLSGAIVVGRKKDGITYYELSGTGEELGEDTLSWFILWGLSANANIRWRNKFGSHYHIGSKEFSEAIS